MNGTSFSSTHISAKVKSASNRQLLGRKLEIRALRCRENLGSERPGCPSLSAKVSGHSGQRRKGT
ncbi:hypothetical protein Mapa_004947 [Marchantia paleacea]|nr:hypothetical protein Mapa_004947 [Marchantia paleacea]